MLEIILLVTLTTIKIEYHRREYLVEHAVEYSVSAFIQAINSGLLERFRAEMFLKLVGRFQAFLVNIML